MNCNFRVINYSGSDRSIKLYSRKDAQSQWSEQEISTTKGSELPISQFFQQAISDSIKNGDTGLIVLDEIKGDTLGKAVLTDIKRRWKNFKDQARAVSTQLQCFFAVDAHSNDRDPGHTTKSSGEGLVSIYSDDSLSEANLSTSNDGIAVIRRSNSLKVNMEAILNHIATMIQVPIN